MPQKTKILFVDDESRVLRGLRRQLVMSGVPLDAAFAQSGATALDMMAETSFDVLVTDIKMSRMTGVTLLEKTRDQHPDVIRIALSGQADMMAMLRSANLAQRYLTKPTDIEEIVQVVDQLINLRRTIEDEKLATLLGGIKSLPSLPNIYQALQAELASPKASAKSIGQLIAKDIGMTAKILQLINSAYFGIPNRVTDPVQAVVLLGVSMMKGLVLSEHIFSSYEKTPTGMFSMQKTRMHALLVANFARKIAQLERMDKHAQDFAYVAGMLHDIGKIVLATNFTQDYNSVLTAVKQSQTPIVDAEMAVFGASHAEVGGYLLSLWGFQTEVIEAVVYHHRPATCFNQELSVLTVIHAANFLAYELTDVSSAPQFGELDFKYLKQVGVFERYEVWRKTCHDEFAKVAGND